MVVKFAEIRPATVRLEGQAGTPLTVEVEIQPNKDYPFTILGLQAQRNDTVRGEVLEQCNTETNRCVIRVENLKTTSGRYSDTIIVQTDNKARPTFVIPIVGIVH